MLWQIFWDFGWIPFVIIVFKGSWKLWVQWRQNKYAATIETCLLAVEVPRQNEQTAKAVEHIFATLSGAYSGLDRFEKYWLGKFQPTFSFEIASINGYVQFVVHTWTKHRDLVEAAIFAQYPDAEVVEIADYTSGIPTKYPHPEWNVFGTEFVLKRPSHLPIRTYSEFEHTSAEDPFKDPISALLEVMGSLKSGEQMWFQLLVNPTDSSWKDAGQKAVEKMLGRKPTPKKSSFDEAMWLPKGVAKEVASLLSTPSEGGKKEEKKDDFRVLNMSPGERSVVEAVQMKLAKIGFEAKMRIVYAGRRDIFNKKRFTAIKGALMQYNALNMNEIKTYGKVTPKDDYFHERWSVWQKKMKLVRCFRGRSGKGAPSYVLNIEELATLYHFPMRLVKTPLLKKTDAKRAEPPAALPMLGESTEGFFKPIKKTSTKDQASDSAGEPPADLPFA
ncbi:hypothetical protein KKE28_04075 [Patescibacteria group bacterium]|nr:hypothetical protein [Patescibacteria group bacterium]MBU1916352.1 hypothetical protein [Patescibacteria group bacterium]